RNEIVTITMGANGHFQLGARTTITSQGPRAVAVSNGLLFVAAHESGNQTEFPSCGPNDPVNFVRGQAGDEGCEFPLNQGTLLQFATSPNVGGEVIHDQDIPDRDLFVYSTSNLTTPLQVISGIGTLLNGIAVAGGRVFVTNTDARNDRDGLAALGNRMFENRLSLLDCGPTCGAVTRLDLDANPFGVPIPTPYGVAASGDGQVFVMTAAGSDGKPGIPSAPGSSLPGLVTLSRAGAVL